jgi:hypothetical protein
MQANYNGMLNGETRDSGHYPQSVVQQLPMFGGVAPTSDILLFLAGAADDIPVWGTNVRSRDRILREFYKSEYMLSGTVYGTCARYASFKYVLSGPERQVNIMQRILHNSEHGSGWQKLMIKAVKDELTQDNAGFIEAIRTADDYKAPVIQLNHLDSSRCQRTGNWEVPVVYTDVRGGMHKLKWYQVYDIAEYPDPDERFRGYQQCAVSRLLGGAQKMRDVSLYEREKFSGRNPTEVNLVSGIAQERIMSILKLDQNKADNTGQQRYMIPSIIAGLDPTARVALETIKLRGSPDGWDKAEDFKEYIILLALAFGLDPQDIAPIQGGGLGSSQQSQVLAQKGRGKGPALFMSTIEHMMNFHGIMPASVTFHYEEQDDAENEAKTNLWWRRIQGYAMLAKPTKGTGNTPGNTPGASTAMGENRPAGSKDGEPILPVKIIRQIMRDNGDLSQEYLDALGEEDLTPVTDLASDDKPAVNLAKKGWLDKMLGI